MDRTGPARILPASLACLLIVALSGCTAVPTGDRGSSNAPMGGAPGRTADAGAARQCLTQLGSTGAGFSPLPDRYLSAGCSQVGTVQISDLASDDARLSVTNIGPVTCEVSKVFADWARFGADRAARQILGTPLRTIETFGSYSCRNVAGTARRSGHASAAAIDVSGFVLADGRRVTIATGWDGRDEAERRFLRAVQQSACRRFATVLSPAYNAAHRDHLHIEGVIAGRSFCR